MNKRRKNRFGIILILIIIGLLVNFVHILIDQQKVLYAKGNEMISIKSKIEEENKIRDKLLNQKKSLNSNEYIEKVAREKLGMVKQGEKIFIDVNK